MKKTFIVIILLVSLYACREEVPGVYFNHLYVVIEKDDLQAIRESSFLNDTLVVCETRTTVADSQATWTGTYVYGSDNYFEFFDNSDDESSLGRCGIGFSVDGIGEMDILKNKLENSYETIMFPRERYFNGKKVPWFDALFISDSAFYMQSLFNFWIMEYKPEYFRYKDLPITNEHELTRENYLIQFEPERRDKIIKRFSGIVMKLSPYEKEFLTEFFSVVNYERINKNNYLAPGNFTFRFTDRSEGDQIVIESILFETNMEFPKKEIIPLSDGITIIIEGNSGQIQFYS